MGGKGGGGGGGGKGKGGAATPAPDFSKAAMAGSSNPMGSRTWSYDANGRPTLSTNFTGQAADTFNALQGGMNKAANFDPTQAYNNAVTSYYNQGMSRLQPQQAQAMQGFNSQAANMGLNPGSQGYQTGLGNLQRQQTDQQNSLMAAANQQGLQNQQVQMQQMMQPFQQASGMLGMLGQQGDTSAPLKGAMLQYEAGKDATSANQGKKGQTLGGLGSLAGTVFGGPLGGALGGAAGNALGNNGSGKKGAGTAQDFSPGGVYEGWT